MFLFLCAVTYHMRTVCVYLSLSITKCTLTCTLYDRWMFECVPLCISTCVCLECKHICAFLGVCTTCFVTTSISLYIWDAFVPYKYASCILLLVAVEKMKQELFPVVELNIKKHRRSKRLTTIKDIDHKSIN